MVLAANSNDQRYLAYSGSVISGLTGTVGYPGGAFYNDRFKTIRVGLEVEAEGGTTPALAWAIEWQSPGDLSWNALLDNAGAAVTGVAFAAAATGLRYLDLHTEALPDEDAVAGVMTYGTNYKKYGSLFIPYTLRLVLTLTGGGGTLSKTYNAFVMGQVG